MFFVSQRLRLRLPGEAPDRRAAPGGGTRLFPDPQPVLPRNLRRQVLDEELQEPQGMMDWMQTEGVGRL